INAGANVIVSGSAIFKSKDIKGTIERFRTAG
ncbi:MAG TPA: ribulose-phosphate 3-epimerase, partial [Clostridiaceae bacterium]|nr:ribulose-phosphate 3-epimerase [Clostridiaceae bacterium]